MQPPSSLGFDQSDPGALSSAPEASDQPSGVSAGRPKTPILARMSRRIDVALAILIILGMAGVFAVTSTRSDTQPPVTEQGANSLYETQNVSLEEFEVDAAGVSFESSKVVINGSLETNNGLVITPSLQPSSPRAGQLYFDEEASAFAYYDGAEFVTLGGGVETVGGATGQVGLGGGLAVVGNQLVNSGVLSLGGQGGAIVLGNGMGLAGNTLQNTGVLSVIGGTDISVVSDGNGNFTINNTGAGTGTVTSGGGSSGIIPLFTSAQNIENSIISQSGGTVNIAGSLGLGNALAVSNGGTGAISLAANGVIVGNGTSALSSVAAGGAGLCLISTAGAPSWSVCPGGGGGGVTDLNGLTGSLAIANASAAGSTITIDDATTVSKGIASFNGTNFTVTSGKTLTPCKILTLVQPLRLPD